MKFKKLTKEQTLISIDRLTRFKNTKEKYMRVFLEIVCSNLINPKLKRADIEVMPPNELVDIVNNIFEYTYGRTNNLSVNKQLSEHENSVFINDDDTQILLNNNINYEEIIKLIDDNACVNLKWLKSLSKDVDRIDFRRKHFLKYPLKTIVLAEGVTEEILLPAFAKFLNFDFYAEGIQIIASGGKNQVVKMYYKMSEETKLPIFLLLDKDAEDNIEQIKPKLRDIDAIHLVECGEFEDLLPKSLIVKTVNSQFKNFLSIKPDDLDSNIPMAKVLEEMYKTKGLHEFKKSEFAKSVREHISEKSDISGEIVKIIEELTLTCKSLDTKICS